MLNYQIAGVLSGNFLDYLIFIDSCELAGFI
jgi:hypothetical protein